MSIRRILEIAAFCVVLLVAIFAICAWIASRREQQNLKVTLAGQKQIISAVGVRERARDSTLNNALAQIAKLKRATQSPSQIIRELPEYLPLPQPITFKDSANRAKPAFEGGSGASERTSISSPGAPRLMGSSRTNNAVQVPTSDLKPLYDFVQDYRACQLRLTAANQNAADQADKEAALTRERDVAISAAKGGSFWRRLRGNAVWFVIGVGAGYAVSKR